MKGWCPSIPEGADEDRRSLVAASGGRFAQPGRSIQKGDEFAIDDPDHVARGLGERAAFALSFRRALAKPESNGSDRGQWSKVHPVGA